MRLEESHMQDERWGLRRIEPHMTKECCAYCAVVASGGGCASLASESTMAWRKERWCSRKEVTWPPGTHLVSGGG